jgi:hypothetical protein
MFALSKKFGFAVGILVVLGGYGLPAGANDLTEVLGPVGPNDPIITTVGRKGVLAFYEADGSRCGMHVVMTKVVIQPPGSGSPSILARWFTSTPPRIERSASNAAAPPTRWRSSTLAKCIQPGLPNKPVVNLGHCT